MAIFTALMPSPDRAADNDGHRDTDYWHPRTVELGGHLFCTDQRVLDEVAAGQARFDYRPYSTWHPEGIAFVVTDEGTTLRTGTVNYHDDYDLYAVVWAGDRLKHVTYTTTRGGGTDDNYVVLDATPEVVDAVTAWQTTINLGDIRAREISDLAHAIGDFATPGQGKRVRVVRGRKVKVGTVGEVFWTGPGFARYGSTSTRIGIRGDDSETYWTDANNAQVIDFDEDDLPREVDFRRPDDEALALATSRAEHTWRPLTRRVA